MARSFKLPDLGEGIHEGEVLRVLVKVGDEVSEGDPIFEVETDKAAVEIPSPFTGSVTEILIQAGDLIKVGEVVMAFDGEAQQKTGNKTKTAGRPPESAKPLEPEPSGARQPVAASNKGPVPASPATRRLARELDVDLAQIPASGPAGLVTADDVKAFAERAQKAGIAPSATEPASATARPLSADAPRLPDFEKWGPVERIPVRSIRRATARQMALSWSQIPHVSSQDMVDLTELEAFRRKHKAAIEAKGGRLTLTVFALKAAVTALKTFPNFNATLDAAAGEIIRKHYFHLGVAVDTEEGLIVPVIRDVDRKSITELAIELSDLVQRTRLRKTTLEQMQGASFTITNVGPMGGGHFAPIINFPQVAIMGMGAACMQPVVKTRAEGRHEIVARLMMPLVLCIDHRVLDGADSLRFMQVVKTALEDPDALLMTMV